MPAIVEGVRVCIDACGGSDVSPGLGGLRDSKREWGNVCARARMGGGECACVRVLAGRGAVGVGVGEIVQADVRPTLRRVGREMTPSLGGGSSGGFRAHAHGLPWKAHFTGWRVLVHPGIDM